MTDTISPDKDRRVANSLERLNKAASEGRFRIKSMVRAKTIQAEEEKCATDRDYEGQLTKKMFSKQFLKSLYIARSQQSQLKMSDSKYAAFLRSLHQRVQKTNMLNLSACNFQKGTAQMFLNEFIAKNDEIICYDVSRCTFLAMPEAKIQQGQWMLEKIIRKDRRVVKLVLRNMGLSSIDIKKIFNLLVETSRIFELDISNQNSQSMNRFAQEIDLLYEFLKYNPTVAVLNLCNLNIRKNGVEHIQKGISANAFNPLKILNLKNNAINDQASLQISMIVRTGLVELDLSENPLGPKFFLNLPNWKANTVRKLNLAMTDMNSEALIFFLTRLEENKMLEWLKLDGNDFSNHWFNQTKQMFEVNTSIQDISFVDCKINRVSQTFLGLFLNRHLKKINISNNIFGEGVKEMSDCIKVNKNLSEIRFRGCGLVPTQLIQFFEALANNTFIHTLDISQNQVGQEGGKQILKTLNQNNALCSLTAQKTQIPFAIRESIQKKITANRQIKKKRQLNQLKKQNKIVKQLDVYTWDDVQELEQKVRTNSKTILSLESKVAGLEKQYDQKKHRFNEIVKDCNEKEQKLSDDVAQLMKKMKQIETQEHNIIKKYKQKEENIKNAAEKQEQSIKNLQKLILQEGEKNRKRENELEDHYQNFKYIQKKKEGKKQSQPKKTMGFDAVTSINSKRKSRNI